MSIERAIELQEQAWRLQAEGKIEDAVLACRESLRLLEESEDTDSPDVANILNDLAEMEAERQDFRSGLAFAERAGDILARLSDRFSGEDAARVRVRTLELLGSMRRDLGDYARAEIDLKQAVAMAVAEFGSASTEAATARNNLGVVYKHGGRFEKGLKLYRQALGSVNEKSLEAGIIFHNIGGILHAQGDFVAAEEPARRAWEISRALLGEEHPRTMLDAAAYAGVLAGIGKYEEGERIYRRALEVFEAAYGPEHYEVAANLHGLAAVLDSRGDYQEAEKHYRRALAIKESLLGAESPDAALTRHNLGSMLNRVGRSAEAVPLLESAVAALEQRLMPTHPDLTLARANLQDAVRSLTCSAVAKIEP